MHLGHQSVLSSNSLLRAVLKVVISKGQVSVANSTSSVPPSPPPMVRDSSTLPQNLALASFSSDILPEFTAICVWYPAGSLHGALDGRWRDWCGGVCRYGTAADQNRPRSAFVPTPVKMSEKCPVPTEAILSVCANVGRSRYSPLRADEAGLRLSPNTLAAVAEQAGLRTGLDGGLPAAAAIQFFKRSLLPSATLNSIWRFVLTLLEQLSVALDFSNFLTVFGAYLSLVNG